MTLIAGTHRNSSIQLASCRLESIALPEETTTWKAWVMTRVTAATIRRLLTRHRLKMVHAVRMTTASITAFLLDYSLGLSEGLWAVITAIVVTQSSVGSLLKMAFDQFAGSLLAAPFTPLPLFS
jgi:uncharacterized membrane protein YccC